MTEINIPLRPKGYSNKTVKECDADVLTYSVLFRVSNAEAYVRFHPGLADARGRPNRACQKEARQFFEYAKHREYIDAYAATLAEYAKEGTAKAGGQTLEISDKRKDEALRSLFDKAMTIVEGEETLDPDTLKVATEIFRKIGLLKDDVEVQEKPRRYLPERCGDCEYKKFIDEQVRLGNIEETKN